MDLLPDWAVEFITSDSGGPSTETPGGRQALRPGGDRNNIMEQYSLIEQTVSMDIRTADPEKAGKAASDGLQRQLEDARNQTRGRGGR